MWISEALAQSAGGGGQAGGLFGGDGLASMLPLILIFVVFYFLLIRPQQKRQKALRDMIASVRRGDRVVTNGGIIGLVTKVVADNEVMLEIAEGVRVRVLKSTIAEIRDRGQPVRGGKDDDGDAVVEPPVVPSGPVVKAGEADKPAGLLGKFGFGNKPGK